MDRRSFLKLFGVGAATAIVAPQLLAPEPHRRIWQVSRYAPVGSRFYGVRDILAESGGALFGWDHGHDDTTAFVWFQWDDATQRVTYERIGYEEARSGTALATLEGYWADRDGELQRIMTQKLANHRAAFEAAMSADWDRLPTPIQEMLDGIARSVALEVPPKSGSMAALFHAMATEHRDDVSRGTIADALRSEESVGINTVSMGATLGISPRVEET